MEVPFDMARAMDGYLTTPEGRPGRYVWGLDVIAREVMRVGATIVWGQPVISTIACYCADRRQIVLAPWLHWVYGPQLKTIITHELGHAVVGMNDLLVQPWQRQHFGELLLPAWVA